MLYQPAFEGPISNWTSQFVHQNHWRVRLSCPTREDAMQESMLVFVKCKRQYCDTGKVICRPHFFSLYKTSVCNRFHRLANKDTKIRGLEQPMLEDAETNLHDPIGETENSGFLAVMVRQAPEEVKLVLNLLLQAPNELLGMALSGSVTMSDNRLSRRLVALLGLPKGSDPLGATRAYLQQSVYGEPSGSMKLNRPTNPNRKERQP